MAGIEIKKDRVIRGVFVIFGIVIFGWGVYGIKMRFPAENLSSKLNVENTIESDLLTQKALSDKEKKVFKKLKESLINKNNNSNIEGVWLSENLQFYLNDKNKTIRKAALISLRLTCPVQRWRLLYNFIMREKDKELLSEAFHIPRDFGGRESINFLTDILKNPHFSKPQKSLIRSELFLAKKNKIKPCSFKIN